MPVSAYPLAWPVGWKRQQPGLRTHGKFKRASRRSGSYGDGTFSYTPQRDLTITEAVTRVRMELHRFGVKDGDVVISTNIPVRLDGLPRGDARQPDDPGAAVYWQRQGEPMRCMAIEQYRKVQDNLAAIAATLDAMRAIERHGGAAILDRAFTGFAAPPAPTTERSWRDVLEVDDAAPLDQVRIRYRTLAARHHPDKGGNAAKMAEINRAWEQAQQALS